MALSLGNIAIGAEGLYLGNILIGADNAVITAAPPQPLFVEWIIVAGGGGGGFRGTSGGGDLLRGGGGGAGGLVTGSVTLQPITGELEIEVSAGGTGAASESTRAFNGNNASLTDNNGLLVFINGGGPAGTYFSGDNDYFAGGPGGSGGGGFSIVVGGAGGAVSAYGGGAGTQFSDNGVGYGRAGCAGGTASGDTSSRGGAGGSSKPGTSTSCPNSDSGYVWVDGVEYGRGGDPSTTGAQTAGKGFGGNCNNNGSNGVCVVRYAGTTQRADGGTITTSGGYTYHTFDYTGGAQFLNNIR
jgi:hypothetical protein